MTAVATAAAAAAVATASCTVAMGASSTAEAAAAAAFVPSAEIETATFIPAKPFFFSPPSLSLPSSSSSSLHLSSPYSVSVAKSSSYTSTSAGDVAFDVATVDDASAASSAALVPPAAPLAFMSAVPLTSPPSAATTAAIMDPMSATMEEFSAPTAMMEAAAPKAGAASSLAVPNASVSAASGSGSPFSGGGGRCRGRNRLSKAIWKCGSDWERALDLLYGACPFLRPEEKGVATAAAKGDGECVPKPPPPLDGRAAAAAVEVLGKCGRVDNMLRLLDRVVDMYPGKFSPRVGSGERNHVASDAAAAVVVSSTESDVRLCYRSALPGAGLSGDVDLVLRLLRVDPISRAGLAPGADAYHAAIAACGRCCSSGGADTALGLLAEMERGEEVQLEWEAEQSVAMAMETDASKTATVTLKTATEGGKDADADSLCRPGAARSRRYRYVPPPPDRMAYQTALTACVRSKRCDDASAILSRMRRRGIDPDVASYNQVVAAFEKVRGRSADAIRLLDEMCAAQEREEKVEGNDGKGGGGVRVAPNAATYNLVISACGKDGAWDAASVVMERMRLQLGEEWGCNSRDRGRNGARSAATTEEEPLPNATTTTTTAKSSSSSDAVQREAAAATEGVLCACESFARYFRALDRLPKHGSGRDAWWEIGRYRRPSAPALDVIVAVQPHRNPIRNGVSLNFHDASDDKLRKMGFMLLRNGVDAMSRAADPSTETAAAETAAATTTSLRSSVIGMLVDESQRGKGLSTLFVALWLRLCVDIGAAPGAERINKPLISLALGRFGFVPREGAVRVEVSPVRAPPASAGEDGKGSGEGARGGAGMATVELYSPKRQALEGVFGARERRLQGLVIRKEPPMPRGKLVYVKTGFDHPISMVGDKRYHKEDVEGKLEANIQEALGVGCGGRVDFLADTSVVRGALFGFAVPVGEEDVITLD